jgi:periplasmic protein TonB
MFSHRKWAAWGMAAAGAAALNLALFALVPYLLRADPEKPAYDMFVSGINIIRMQEPEPEEPERVEEPEKEEETPEPEEAAAMPKPVETEMQLPFEINPRLPSGPQSLELPPMMTSGISVTQDTFSAGDLDQPLTAVIRMPPVYPMSAKRRNIEGYVSVRFVVNEEGTVETIDILEEKPPGIFDRAVIDCVSGWRFNPGTVGGVPVRTVAETTIRFELD